MQTEYAAITLSQHNATLPSRIDAAEHAVNYHIDYLFTYDTLARLTNPDTLLHLVQQA